MNCDYTNYLKRKAYQEHKGPIGTDCYLCKKGDCKYWTDNAEHKPEDYAMNIQEHESPVIEQGMEGD
jgi:hypothetical protein